ncbi:hypothetical protein EV199_1574 [Pseudobacter ginsenosidimutans]|uniref:Uncharacterized protein n=1 Tax=Pseudobacter ginsenosidimutans TaxID=661488 RepID=A0A4Q7N3Z0_9BACT|nr:hypothetical protein EV199_1574 [Pseudobacter ginsenosidimutans]
MAGSSSRPFFYNPSPNHLSSFLLSPIPRSASSRHSLVAFPYLRQQSGIHSAAINRQLLPNKPPTIGTQRSENENLTQNNRKNKLSINLKIK